MFLDYISFVVVFSYTGGMPPTYNPIWATIHGLWVYNEPSVTYSIANKSFSLSLFCDILKKHTKMNTFCKIFILT